MASEIERYTPIKLLGEGSYGRVWKALNRQTNEVVAIKNLKREFHSVEECVNLREVKALCKLNHPNIVKLIELIRENYQLYFVFEYMEYDLHQMMKNKDTLLPEAKVRNLCYQVLQALNYMHRSGYFHRDLKPHNLLVTKDVIKVADFGHAREVRSLSPYTDDQVADFGLAGEVRSLPPYTHGVTTRWYRAPEVLLGSSCYNAAIDMWAMGTIMAELFTLRPLFTGENAADQLYKICEVIGTPNVSNWSDGLKLAASLNYCFPQLPSTDLSVLIPNASPEAIDLMTLMCSWDPSKRPTASQALAHPFFQAGIRVPPSTVMRKTVIPCVPDGRAFPKKQIHDQTDRGSFLESVHPATEKLNELVQRISQIKLIGPKNAASAKQSSSVFSRSIAKPSRYRLMVNPQGLPPRVDSALVSVKPAPPIVTTRQARHQEVIGQSSSNATSVQRPRFSFLACKDYLLGTAAVAKTSKHARGDNAGAISYGNRYCLTCRQLMPVGRTTCACLLYGRRVSGE